MSETEEIMKCLSLRFEKQFEDCAIEYMAHTHHMSQLYELERERN